TGFDIRIHPPYIVSYVIIGGCLKCSQVALSVTNAIPFEKRSQFDDKQPLLDVVFSPDLLVPHKALPLIKNGTHVYYNYDITSIDQTKASESFNIRYNEPPIPTNITKLYVTIGAVDLDDEESLG
ncbi:5171_t:CDS:2, partial [Dentiscutata heterogama]